MLSHLANKTRMKNPHYLYLHIGQKIFIPS